MLLIIVSAFCFAAMNNFVHLAGDLPTVEKSFFRNLVTAIFSGFLLIRGKTRLEISGRDLPLLLVRSICGTIGILCNFYAVDHLLVGDASMLNKLSPFFVIIFSALILKEIPSRFQIMCLVLAMIGCALVVKPGFASTDMSGMSAGLLGGMAAGAAYTAVRILGGRGVKGPVIVFFFSAFSCLSVIPMMILWYHEPISPFQFLALIGAGLAAAGGQFTITAAYRYAPGREISIYDYSNIIFATIIAYFLFGQIPDALSFLGYAVIITASLMMFLYNRKRS